MEQYNLEALKTKRDETFISVKTQSHNLRMAKEHVTHLDAQLRKVQKRYELLDRKIFEMEYEKFTKTTTKTTEKATKKRSTKLSAKLNNILADMSEKELKALIAKHI